MAAKKKAASAGATLLALKDSPALRRLLEDPELRANIAQAFSSTQRAYGRLDGKKAGKQLFDDKRLQKDLKSAADSIRDAGLTLREAPSSSKSKGGGLFRKLLLLGVAGGLALALSEDLRKKVLDALFGAEEEFEYTSTTTPAGGGASGGVSTPAGTTT